MNARRTFVVALVLGTAALSADAARVTHLFVVGTNDIHGAVAPRSENPRQGGLALLAGFVDALRNEHPGHVIWLDAGDEFQGSIESNSTKGAVVVRALNVAGVTAAAVGNHEFDFGSGTSDGSGDSRRVLRSRIREAHYPFLAANVTRRFSGRSPFPNGSGSVLRTIDGIHVGIIGMITRSTAVTTWPPYVQDLQFADLREATVREAARLRSRGAEVVLLLAHVGIHCEEQAASRCTGELVDLLHALPRGTVDAVVAGHSHTVVETTIDGVPVVEAGWKGEYLNIIDLPFDHDTHRVIADRVRIEGPIANREPAELHQRLVAPDAAVEKILRPVLVRSAPVRNRVIATADVAFDRGEEGETGMGDLVTDALREETKSDFALVNAGGIRAAFAAGPITYGEVFEALPFENKVAVLRLTGRQLKLVLRVAESGAMGFFPVSGLRVTISSCERCPADDLNGDGRIEPWETNRLIDVHRSDGAPIDDDGEYTLATTDFVLEGGDYMGWPIGRIASDHVQFTRLLARDALVAFLDAHSHPGDVPNSRMVFVRADEGRSADRQ